MLSNERRCMLSDERRCMLSNAPVGGAIEAAIQALVNSRRLVHPQEGQAHAAHVDQHIGARYVERIHLLLTRFATHVFRVEKMSISVSRRCGSSAVASDVEACGVSSREVLRGVEEQELLSGVEPGAEWRVAQACRCWSKPLAQVCRSSGVE
jgi:hypothetical protein